MSVCQSVAQRHEKTRKRAKKSLSSAFEKLHLLSFAHLSARFDACLRRFSAFLSSSFSFFFSFANSNLFFTFHLLSQFLRLFAVHWPPFESFSGLSTAQRSRVRRSASAPFAPPILFAISFIFARLFVLNRAIFVLLRNFAPLRNCSVTTQLN